MILSFVAVLALSLSLSLSFTCVCVFFFKFKNKFAFTDWTSRLSVCSSVHQFITVVCRTSSRSSHHPYWPSSFLGNIFITKSKQILTSSWTRTLERDRVSHFSRKVDNAKILSLTRIEEPDWVKARRMCNFLAVNTFFRNRKFDVISHPLLTNRRIYLFKLEITWHSIHHLQNSITSSLSFFSWIKICLLCYL